MIPILFAAAIAVQPTEQPPADVVAAGQAWADCISDKVEAAPARGSPRDQARTILADCRALQTRMTEAHGRWVDASPLSAAEKRDAHAAMRRSIAEIEPQIVTAIRASRED